jgi:hypothetical protein
MPIGMRVVLFAASMQLDANAVIARAQAAGSRTILIAENGAEIPTDVCHALDGVLFRNVAGTDLIDCIRRVACRAEVHPTLECDFDPGAGYGGRAGARPADAERDADRCFDCARLQEQADCDTTATPRSR